MVNSKVSSNRKKLCEEKKIVIPPPFDSSTLVLLQEHTNTTKYFRRLVQELTISSESKIIGDDSEEIVNSYTSLLTLLPYIFLQKNKDRGVKEWRDRAFLFYLIECFALALISFISVSTRQK